MKTKETALGQTFCFIFTSAMTLYSTKINDISFPLFVSKTIFSNHSTFNKYYQSIIYMNISNPSRLINVPMTMISNNPNLGLIIGRSVTCISLLLDYLNHFKMRVSKFSMYSYFL